MKNKEIKLSSKSERLAIANEFLVVIAGCGREFFKHEDFIANFELSNHGRVFFIDYYSRKRIYTHKDGRWKGFSSGGTLKCLIVSLRRFIISGTQMNASYFQENMGNGFRNPWAYGEDIAIVKKSAIQLGVAA